MIYKYITIYNFGGIDQRITCEFSLYEFPEEKLNKIIDNYKITFKVNEILFEEIYKLLYDNTNNKI